MSRNRYHLPSVGVCERRKKVRFHEGVPENSSNAEGKVCLIILNGLLNEVYSKEVCHLFTKGSHHRNISVILITQNLYRQWRFCRDISLNAKYLVLLKSVTDKNQFTHVPRQVYPKDSGSMYQVHLNATAKPHGYLVLDVLQDTDDLLRFRTNLFLKELPPVTFDPVSDETDKVQISRSSSA
jgi:hypothetical protein